MLNQSKEASRHVDAVLSALDILDCFLDYPDRTLKQIIDKTGFTRSRVMRLVGTLEARGYLVLNPERQTYHIGIKLPLLAKSFEKINHVEVLVRPVLKQLAKDTGECATLYVRDGLERVALAREEGTHAIRYTIREGQRYFLHRGGAASKILLAFGPPQWQEEVLSSIKTDTKKFVRSVELARKQGYAISEAENTPGAFSIAAPVFAADKMPRGALAVSGPLTRLDKNKLKELIDPVVEMAKYLSERLGKQQGMER